MHAKNRLIAVCALCVAAILVLVPCTRVRSPSVPPLRVGTSGDYPPFSNGGRGFDIEVAKLLAADLGREVEWVEFRWPDLHTAVRRNAFDVAMGGVTWRPERAIDGFMTRAVAVGGPCIVGRRSPRKVAVNRGGVLEAWARAHLGGAEIITTDDNLALPELLASGRADAFVTDSFEAAHLREPHEPIVCEAPTDRKVYWVSPGASELLASQIDQWLTANEPRLQRLRSTHLGLTLPRTPADHLADLLARRLAFMGPVAATKRAHRLPIEDRARELVVIEAAKARAAARGFDADDAEALFAYQIELAKRVQERTGDDAKPIDLDEARATLITLGDRILDALAELRAARATLDSKSLSLLERYLEPEEVEELRARLNAMLRT